MNNELNHSSESETFQNQSPKSALWISGIAFVLSIFSVIMVLSFTIREYQKLKKDEQKITLIKQTFQKQIDSLNNLPKLIQDQQQQIESLKTQVNKVSMLSSNDERSWLISEAKYLLELAIMNAHFDHNVNGTIALLQRADKRLNATNEPGLIPVRQSIAHDIAALNTLPRIDTDGLYMQLDALRQQSLHLSLINNQFSPAVDQTDMNETQPKADGFWKNVWSVFSRALKKLITIRHQNASIKPLAGPNQRLILSQNIDVLYGQAQWALLKHDQTVYQNSLQQIIHLIQTYFSANTKSLSIISTLKTMQSKKIDIELPNISHGLKALNAYQKSNQIPVNAKTGTE